MNRYEKAKRELDLYFGAYGEELMRPLPITSFHAWSENASTLKTRSVEAFQAFKLVCETWNRVPGITLTLDQLRKAALSFVDVLEHLGAEWPPVAGALE